MTQEVIYRPELPKRPDGSRVITVEQGGTHFYRVTQEDKIVAAYHAFYFQTPNEVIADLLELIRGGRLEGWFSDFAIWWDSRLQAVIHQPMDETKAQTFRFAEDRNAPPAAGPLSWWHGWPSYEQWVAEGKGDIVYDPEKYPAVWADKPDEQKND